MQTFISKHTDKIHATLSCFDRLIFKGHLPFNYAESMEGFLAQQGILIKDFKKFVPKQAARIKLHAIELAARHGRPYEYLERYTRKEELARKIAKRDKINEGLICVLAAVEPCQSFKIVHGKGKPRLRGARRKCLCLYFYYLDPTFGFMHVRIQTWFPFTVQIYINGHEWLARQMEWAGLGFRQMENAFHWLEDPEHTQRIANEFVGQNWPSILETFASEINPLMGDLLEDMSYYWVTDQAEFATDILFTDRASLQSLYQRLLKHATLCLSAEDVLSFLGRKLHGLFAGEVLNDCKKRWPGVRVKHRMKENWIKMYDKHGVILRIETVINHPREFKVYRQGKRNGEKVMGWYPMAKGVANLKRYAKVCQRSNNLYLEALSVVDDPGPAQRVLHKAAEPARVRGRSFRGFNPLSRDDMALFAAVLRGEHVIHGFRNADVRKRLFREQRSPDKKRRLGACVSRLLKRLHVHSLIAKIPRSRRWRVSKRGHTLMSAFLELYEERYPNAVLCKPS